MTLPDQLTAAEFERLKAQEQRMLNSGSWVPQAENVYAARLNESAARESMPDTMSAEQADVAAAQQSVMAETPFGRSVGAEPDYSPTPAVNPADSEPKTIEELRRRQKEVYYDPTYDMPFDEWQEYTKWDRENSGAVEGFLEGLSGAPQALGQLGFNLAKERGQQYLRAMTGDPIGALDTEIATFKEMGRKVGVGLTQFVDWVGGKANDVVTSGRRVGQKQAQIVAALREDGKLTGDPMQDNDTIRMAMEEAAAQGMFDDSQNEQTEDEQAQYQRYLRQKQYDRDYAGISKYSLGGNRVTLPGVKQSFANPITGNVAQPQEATATVGAMAFDPINAVPIGVGALSKVRMLRRLARVTGTPLKYAEQLGASADSWLMRQGDKITSKIPLVGDLPLGKRAAVLAGAAGIGAYVDSKTDGGLSLVTTPLMVAGGILPALKASGTVLRKTGAAGGAGWQIIKEMDAGGVGAARSATAERMASSGVFGQFSQYMRPGASGVESSLRRVSMNSDAPETLRRVARSADNIGITQVARAADDLVSSSLVAGATAIPFALVAPDEQTAGQIVGGAMTLGGALGTAGRFLGRRSARADADISRMLVDVEMAGGDAKSLLSLDYASLDWLAAQQGMTQGKVDVIPLRAQEYRANVDIKNSGAETVAGLHLDRTADGRAKIYVNMGHTAPIAGRVSVKDVQITRNGKAEKASVVRIRGEDGKSDFTVVPKEYPLLVKSGDVVGENTHLARGLSPRKILPHEIGHAILTSNILDGAIRDDMRNLVNQQYGTDGIEARGREYVTRLVDRDIMAGAHDALPDKLTQQEFDDIAAGKVTMADVVKGKPLNDAERTRLINERMEEMRDQSRSSGNSPDGLDVFRDEVVAETFSSLSESIDFRNMRTGGPRVMESIYNGMTRMFETLGLNFDQSTGKLLDNPSVIFRDNPLTKDPVMRKRLQEHVRNYEALMVNMEQVGQRKQRGTAVSSDGTAESARRSTHTKLRPNDNGILENDIIFIDQNGNAQWKPQNMLDEQERGRASQVMFLYEKDKILPANSKEFGRRRAADGRILISGPTLPAKFDALRWFPRWLRPNKSTGDIGLARTLEASRDEGMSYIFDVNVIGSGESGRYRVKNRGDIRAVIREGAFIGWQATKNHHLNAVVLDLNAFRSSSMKAINDGKLGVFNNDMTQLQADLMQYMSNHKNGLPGEAGIGIEKRDLLNGLIGTGTAVQRAANPLHADLNPRGSIRTFRVDRLNDARPTGRTGYHIDYDKINNNRMPQAMPDMQLDDGSTLRYPKQSWQNDMLVQHLGADAAFKKVAQARGEAYLGADEFRNDPRNADAVAAYYQSHRQANPWTSLAASEVVDKAGQGVRGVEDQAAQRAVPQIESGTTGNREALSETPQSVAAPVVPDGSLVVQPGQVVKPPESKLTRGSLQRFGRDYMPIGSPARFMPDAPQYTPANIFADKDAWAIVNRRLGTELEVVERLLGKKGEQFGYNVENATDRQGNAIRVMLPQDLADLVTKNLDTFKALRTAPSLVDAAIANGTVNNAQAAVLRDALGGSPTLNEVKQVNKKLPDGAKLSESQVFALGDLHFLRSNSQLLGDNGKTGASTNLALLTCHPTEGCANCYAAKQMSRPDQARKALRDTILLFMDPEGYGKQVAAEAASVKKDKLPFIRMHGSGEMNSQEHVRAFNSMAKHADRPIHVFSRKHDLLGQLQSTQNAPFVRMGSIDGQLAVEYGYDFLEKNLSERGIANAFLYSSPDELVHLEELYKRDALPLILSASHELHSTLPDHLKAASCPCDAGERSYVASCRACAMSNAGCFMAFADKGVDANGKMWKFMDPASPDDLSPIAAFVRQDGGVKAWESIATEILKKSASSLEANSAIGLIKKFRAGLSRSLRIRDIRRTDALIYTMTPEGKSWHVNAEIGTKDAGKNPRKRVATFSTEAGARGFIVKKGEAYVSFLKKLLERTKSGTFWTAGGDASAGFIQPSVVFKEGKRVTGQDALDVKAGEIGKFDAGSGVFYTTAGGLALSAMGADEQN